MKRDLRSLVGDQEARVFETKLISLDKVTTNKFTKQTIWKCLHELGRPLEGISNNESWTQLKQFVNTQDKHRGINIKNYIPDLAKYFQ